MNGTYLTKRTVDVFDGTILKEGAFISFCEIDPEKQDLGTAIKFGPPVNGLIHTVLDHEIKIVRVTGESVKWTTITTSQLQGVGSTSDGMKYKILGVTNQAF